MQYIIFVLTVMISFSLFYNSGSEQIIYSDQDNDEKKFIGVNMKGMYTSLNYEKFPKFTITSDYYNDSFKLIKSIGLNHIRYVLYWEAYENNPKLFLQELKNVALLADKWGLNIIYDNHQFHTSSQLDEKRGTGFPPFLFKNVHSPDSETKKSSNLTELWWTNWWNRNITDQNNKIDGWILQADFLKTIVRLLDGHNSTLGYEILNEPQIFLDDQWSKIGKYYTFMINELRKETNKTMVVDMTIPIKFNGSSFNLTSQNMAKIIPKDDNSIFKISLYGIPIDNNYQERKIELLENVSKITQVPLYVGEWNHVIRDSINKDVTDTSKINIKKSDLTQDESDFFVTMFDDLDTFGWAFWNWNYVSTPPENFNLIGLTRDGDIVLTKYFYILKNSVNKLNTDINLELQD